MFLPRTSDDENAKKKDEEKRKAAFQRIENWALELVSPSIRNGVQIHVQEVQCGDPNCAPIDTAVTIMFESGGRGMMGIPSEAADVTQEMLREGFPTSEVLSKWSRGEEADWPPFDDDEDVPDLRFEVGQRVQCRIGPDPVKGWASGKVVQLWYREPGWPEGSWAPYKIQLDDGRNIFAPGDMDQVIRAEPQK